jgi:ring-1,2-phenylacetyl-CoA epoxidase subunit PaaD
MVDTASIWSLLETVNDPEVPVLSVVDLGIIRDVLVRSGSGSANVFSGGVNAFSGDAETAIEVIVTPTYSGCPAMDVIRMSIRMVLLEAGYKNLRLTTVLSPAWTTEWMTEKGKEKLKAYGIAPPLPLQQTCQPMLFHREEAIECPHCHSFHTALISEFGSTACKSLYRCEDCREPFDYFKCH